MRKRDWAATFAGLLVLMVILNKCGNGEHKQQAACDDAVTQGQQLLAKGDLAGAGAQSVHANLSCTGESRSKAEQLQEAIVKAENAGNTCARSYTRIGSQLDNHQLDSAASALDKLNKRCAAESAAKKLRQRVATAQSAASNAASAARRALDKRDAAAAAQAIDKLADANRESNDLAGLRSRLELLRSEQAAASAGTNGGNSGAGSAGTVSAGAGSAGTTAPTAATAGNAPAGNAPARNVTPVPTGSNATAGTVPASREPVTRTPAAPPPKSDVHNAKADMAAGFIQDAETALSQSRFDAARTYLDSARRMDPNNPRLDSLARQIRDRERQLLQTETLIK